MASLRGNGKTKASTARRPVRPGRNAPRSEKVQASLVKAVINRTFLIISAALIIAVSLAALFILWFNKVYADPENVFWGMVSNNLTTQGVTKSFSRADAGGRQIEYTQLSLNPEPAARSVKVLDVKDEAGQSIKLTIEAILTPEAEYQHYTNIERPGAGSSGNYSAIYNMWLKASTAENGRSAGFDNAFFGVLFFGNFDRNERQIITDKLKAAYQVDFKTASKKIINGRRTYTYKATISLREYTKAVVEYAKLLGTPANRPVDPNEFSPDNKIVVEVTVDTLTRQVKSVRYDQAVTETYGGYGLPAELNPPGRTVTSEQLQKAIQDAGQ